MRCGIGVPARPRREAQLQVLLDREARKDLAALRHVADAQPRALRAAAASVTSAPSKRIAPERAGRRPARHLSSVVLPTPLRPRIAVTAPDGASNATSRSMWLPP